MRNRLGEWIQVFGAWSIVIILVLNVVIGLLGGYSRAFSIPGEICSSAMSGR
jgi:hypothetical protein